MKAFGTIRFASAVGRGFGFPLVFMVAFGAGILQAAQPAAVTAQQQEQGPLAAAATDLAARLAPDGSGIRWEVVQDQVASLPDDKPSLVLSAISRGYAKGSTFVQDIRHSSDLDLLYVFDAATPDFMTVVEDQVVWRNEGDGYFATERARTPGLGIDPFTLTRLPDLLRRLAEVTDLGDETVDGVMLHHYAGAGDAADWPGIIAADGVAFTASPISVDLWLDGNNRLVRLSGVTQNLAETDVPLIIHTTVTFSTDLPPLLAEPLPKLVGSPEPAP